jgi:hypothetical protein
MYRQIRSWHTRVLFDRPAKWGGLDRPSAQAIFHRRVEELCRFYPREVTRRPSPLGSSRITGFGTGAPASRPGVINHRFPDVVRQLLPTRYGQLPCR